MNAAPNHPWRRTTGWLLIVLVLPVLWLFRASFLPTMVLFSNDGPLGVLVSQADTVIHTFTGLWRPLNWVGNQDPSSQPDLTMGLFIALGSPVLFAKFYAPLALILLGLSAWFFTRRAGFHPAVGLLVGVAAALSSNPLSYACWGLPPKAIALAFTLAALGLLLGSPQAGWKGWLRVLLAGLCVGLNVVEGADVGAILSLYVAAFAGWQIVAEPGAKAAAAVRGGARLALVAVCAAWIAAHSLSSLVGTQIKGVAGMAQDAASREKRWEFATFGSFPPPETLRFAVPGIFGYRMDSPGGGAYWGGVGGDGTPQTRFSGSGEYVGVLVLLVGAFGVATSLRREKSPFTTAERRFVWFWAVVALGSLLLAFGKFAPFYRFFFELPFFSTIRFPGKFLHGMNLACWILFAYGLEALARSCFGAERKPRASFGDQLKVWRQNAPAAERRWVVGSLALLGLAVLAAVLYAGRAQQLDRYLATIPFGQGEPATAAFSIREVWLAVAFLAVSVGAVALAVIGWFGGPRAKAGWLLLGAILIFDLVRANTPWVKHYDHKLRYQSNPVVDLLKERPWEHRVSAFVRPMLNGGQLVYSQEFPYFPLLYKEWLEHHFQYHNVQSLDIDQMPRMPELESAYLGAFAPPDFGLAVQLAALGPQADRLPADQAAQLRALIPAGQSNLFYVTRLWQLTNTRYQLGLSGGIDAFNELFDPAQRRFRVALPYTVALKPGAPQPKPGMAAEEAMQLLTAVPSDQGPLALLEFTGALPRAKLYPRWETVTNDLAMLERLRSPAFDPAQSVVLADEPAGVKPAPGAVAAPGEVAFASYAPKRIVLKTKSAAAGVLLLNDRWHPDWHVTIDGNPAPLLRANFIMRGVAVPAGEHTVEFRFAPPTGMLWVSLSAIGVGLGCVGLLAFARTKES